MKTQIIKKSDLKKIHAVACNEWKDLIESYANSKPFDDEIELSQKQIDEMFNTSDEKQIKILDKFFTREKSIIDRITSFDDACEILDIKPKFNKDDSKGEKAFKKLKIIIKALNEGWKPNFKDPNQRKYWNYFYLKDDVFSFYSTHCNYSFMDVPSALYLKNEKLAKHCVKIAFEEYKDFYLE